MSVHINRVRKARAKLRRALVEAQGGLCAYCFDPMADANDFHNEDRATLDHVFPRRGGGTDATCVAVHDRCNVAKGHRKPTGCELLALSWVRVSLTRAKKRVQMLAFNALQTLRSSPEWAMGGRLSECDCAECRALDARFPDEGRQLRLPMTVR